MKANQAQIDRALAAPPDAVRLFLLHGPDEAGSAALAKRLAEAMGPEAQRVDLDGATLKADPSRLADEAASVSLFGDRSWIRVQPAGEEVLPAVTALLEAPRAGNPVALVMGALKKGSKLLTLCLDHPAVLAFASYAPEGEKAEQLARSMAQASGLRLDHDLARRIVDLTGGDRALMQGEIDKLALYHDAAPDRPAEASHEALDQLSAEAAGEDMFGIVGAVLGGDVPALQQELTRMKASGGQLAGVLRLVLNRATSLAQGGGGGPPRGHWRDQAASERQARLWTAPALARAIERLGEAERRSRTAKGGIADTLIAQELVMVARQAARGR